MNRPSRIIAAALAALLVMPYGAAARPVAPESLDDHVPAPHSIASQMQGRDWEVPGQIVVSYHGEVAARLASKRHGLARQSQDAVVRANGLAIETIPVPRGRDADELLAELNADPAVEWAVHETLSELHYTDSPDDPAFTSTRNLSSDSQVYPDTYSWWLKDQAGSMRVSTLWPNLEINGQPGHAIVPSTEVTVAVIDTGFYMSHPDKGSNIVAGWDYFDHYTGGVFYEDGDVNPVDPAVTGSESRSAHGTCCSGEVGAATDNAEGVSSAGFDNRVAVYKVMGTDDDNAYGLGAGAAVIPTSRVVAAMVGAVDDGAKIITLSLGSSGGSSAAMYQVAADYAYANDVLVVASTGNDGYEDVYYPAACDHVVAVGSYRLDGEDGTDIEVSDFTNYGPELDILGPGQLIYGLTRPDYDHDGSGDIYEPGYTFWSGTSMATPALAGAAALLWRFDPSLSPGELMDLIYSTAEDMGASGRDDATGWGAVRPVDAYAQIQVWPVVDDDAPEYTASDPVTVTIAAQDGGDGVASVSYRLDGAATSTVAAAIAPVAVSGEGGHTLTYWAASDGGQLSPQETTTFTVDTTAPTTTDSAPAGWWASPVDVALSATDAGAGVGATYYSLDGGPSQTYAVPINITAEGTTTITYASVDLVGNREATQTALVRIDSTPPTTTDDAPAGWQTAPVDVTLTPVDTGSGVMATYYSVNGSMSQTYTAPIHVSAEGTTTITYASTDLAINDETLRTTTVRLDMGAPETSDTVQPSYPAKSADFTLSASDAVSGVGSISYRLDTPGTTQTAATDLWEVNVSLPGTRTIEYWALDVAGNESSHSTVEFFVGADDVAPDVTITAPAYSASSPTLFTIDAVDEGVGVFSITYTIDGGAPTTVYSDSAVDSVSGEATHTITYWATDTNANVSTPASQHTLTIDMTPPVTSDDAPSGWQLAPVDVTLTSTDGGSGVASTIYSINGGTPTTYSAPIGISAEGTTTVAYAAVDRAGNREGTQTAMVALDLTPPDTTYVDASPYEDEALIELDATDAGSGVHAIYYSVDGGSQTTYTAPFTVTGYGDHDVAYWSVDAAGNAESVNAAEVRIRATSTHRLAGEDRYETAVLIAREGWADGGSDWDSITDVIIASGEDAFAADPLTASGLSWVYDAPLLLVSRRGASGDVLRAFREIADQNGAVTVHIVGGSTSVPQARIDDIESYVQSNSSGTLTFRRVAGADRYETAEEIAAEVIDKWDADTGHGPDVVLVANGASPASFYDALALSPIAAQKGFPILPVRPDTVPAPIDRALRAADPSAVVVGGGSAVVSSNVVGEIAVTTSTTPERWSGANRYETAVTIADNAVDDKGWLEPLFFGAATTLPDAMTGGSMVGSKGGPLVLTSGDSLTSVTGSWVSANKTDVAKGYIFGGTAVLKPAVEGQIEDRLGY